MCFVVVICNVMDEQYKVPNHASSRKGKLYLITASGLFFLASLTQVALSSNDSEDKALSGFVIFLFGATAILGGGLLEWLIWLANPLYFMSIYMLVKGNNMAKITSILSTFVALSFSTWDNILVSTSGRMGKIDTLGAGYWLWVISLALLAIGVFYILRNNDERAVHLTQTKNY